MEEFDFDADVMINRHKLEEECEKHSSLYWRYAKMEADAKGEQDDASDALDLLMSEKDAYYRDNPPDGAKVTVDAVKAWVTSDNEVVAAREVLRKAKAKVYRLRAMVAAMDHRKGKLDNLVMLWIKNYYSTPGNEGKAHDKATDEKGKSFRTGLGKNRREESNE